jgi:hypothetical protein
MKKSFINNPVLGLFVHAECASRKRMMTSEKLLLPRSTSMAVLHSPSSLPTHQCAVAMQFVTGIPANADANAMLDDGRKGTI